ncbi:hypothetical protein PMIN01_05675 [Paraphaeosphaeria minitans]|uniref:Uncharacterized protein n=1 Tax=Paraphaeosphaeria minitans TaxID=565426 RepID=A0A9P6KR42_9PLEO|nr:hypothetical protein PMIN01_05675 [Paraphaeosphaeria minitans]
MHTADEEPKPPSQRRDTPRRIPTASTLLPLSLHALPPLASCSHAIPTSHSERRPQQQHPAPHFARAPSLYITALAAHPRMSSSPPGVHRRDLLVR